ncbi:MAG: tripartite tricarboxylate transporter TctB family protein [Alphaproteobacteria bacterium]|nr:tripartite tricarboxylate transporter TctB family protein [Alphaproteobacteria bacterium]
MSDQSSETPERKEGQRAPSFLHRTDLWITLVLLAICAGLWYETTTWETVPPALSQNIPPTFFPRVIIGCIVVLTLLLPFESYYAVKQGTDLDEDRSDRIEPMTFLTALGLILIVGLSEWLGTDLSMVLACLLLPMLWGERRWWLLGAFAILFPIAVHAIFVWGLNVHFLPGLLEPILG